MNSTFLESKIALVIKRVWSFGKKFIKHLLKNHEIKKIIVLSRDELKQFNAQNELYDERLRFSWA